MSEDRRFDFEGSSERDGVIVLSADLPRDQLGNKIRADVHRCVAGIFRNPDLRNFDSPDISLLNRQLDNLVHAIVTQINYVFSIRKTKNEGTGEFINEIGNGFQMEADYTFKEETSADPEIKKINLVLSMRIRHLSQIVEPFDVFAT